MQVSDDCRIRMFVSDDRFQVESGWNILTLLGSGHQKPA